MPGPEFFYAFDGIDRETTLVATYFMAVQGGDDVLSRIRQISSLIYPGSWTEVATLSLAAREQFSAKILGVYEAPPRELAAPHDVAERSFIVQLGIPLADVGQSMAGLLTFAGGEILAHGNLKLLDLYLPEAYVQAFPGPRFGVPGLRELLDVTGRPLLLAIVKPGRGYTAEEGAAIFLEAARGGVDIVKDEELLLDPAYCRRTERIRLYHAAERRAFEETGEHTLYAVNITDRADRLLQNALEAVELGANALMVNYLQVGLDALRALREDSRIGVPVLGHNAGATVQIAGTASGISGTLINGKLPRLCGADINIALSGRGGFPVLPERCLLLVREMLSPLYGTKPTLPAVANGMTPVNAQEIIAQYGCELAIGAGSSIFGHPGGPQAGARAFRQAIQAVQDSRPLEEAASEHAELQAALNLWGHR